ncbi:MAG TPA: site-specific integrase [Polyangiaceae bacterium]|nr:site-specific integrase [Polyangiaceae bacterium]
MSKVIKAEIKKVMPWKPKDGFHQFRIIIQYRTEQEPHKRQYLTQVVKAAKLGIAQSIAETLRYEVATGKLQKSAHEVIVKEQPLTLRDGYALYEERMMARKRPIQTITSTRALFENHLFPVLGETALDEINDHAVNTVLKKELADKIAKGQLSMVTANHHVSRLKNCLNLLYQLGKKKTPVPAWEAFTPKTPEEAKPAKHKHAVITKADFEEALRRAAELEDPVYPAFLYLTGHCALRLGEALGLQWSHVHLDATPEYPHGFIRVEYQKDNRGELRHCKGKLGQTEVPLSEKANQALRALQGSQPAGTKMVLTVLCQRRVYRGIVVTRAIREKRRDRAYWAPPHRNDVINWCHALLGTGNVHGARHFAITRLANSGAALKTVKDFARHANVNTTLGYFDSTKAELGAAITKAFD